MQAPEPPLLSRVADAVYWMHRYVERAENVARFVDVNLQLMLDSPVGGASASWAPLVATTGDHALFESAYGAPSRENVMQFLTFDAKYPSSIRSSLRAARENARSVREVISSEMWRQLNEMYLSIEEAARSPERALSSPAEFFDRVKQGSAAFVGTAYLTMTHNEAWHFGRVGRLLERADKTSRIVDVKSFLLLQRDASQAGSAPLPRAVSDEIEWAALLNSASAFEMYRKRFGAISPEGVLSFLLLEAKFPRSMRYCVNTAQRSLSSITGSPIDGTFSSEASAGRGPSETTIAALAAELERSDVASILATGVHGWLDAAQTKLNDLGLEIYNEFFAPRPVASREPTRLPSPPMAGGSQSQSQS